MKDITDDKFTIVKIDSDETGETKVIIKFTDPEKAKEFVSNANEGKTSSDVKKANMVPQDQGSFALKIETASFAVLLAFAF